MVEETRNSCIRIYTVLSRILNRKYGLKGKQSDGSVYECTDRKAYIGQMLLDTGLLPKTEDVDKYS